jgi:hypothetical protein
MNSSDILLPILLILIISQLVYTYIKLKSLYCPDCPECPSIKKNDICDVPSSISIINYILSNIVKNLENSTDGVKYLEENVIFADKVKMKFETDAETILTQMRKDN